jgi:hypothetical protein
VIFLAEKSNKFSKTKFWKEKSVEDVVILGPMAQATLVFTLDTPEWDDGLGGLRQLVPLVVFRPTATHSNSMKKVHLSQNPVPSRPNPVWNLW